MKILSNFKFSLSTLIVILFICNMIVFGLGIKVADELKLLKVEIKSLQTESSILNHQVATLVNHENLEIVSELIQLTEPVSPELIYPDRLAQSHR